MSAKVTTAGKLQGNYAALKKRLAPRIEAGTRAASDLLMIKSQDLVPKDTLALYDSALVRPKAGGLHAEFIVGYGRSDFPPRTEYSPHEKRIVTRWPHKYAMIVHQDPDAAHPNGRSFFLSAAVEMHRNDMIVAFNAAAGV